MPDNSLIGRLYGLRQFYQSGQTRPFRFRKQQLQKLKAAILSHEKDLHDALYADLKKSPEESWVTETGFLISEINSAPFSLPITVITSSGVTLNDGKKSKFSKSSATCNFAHEITFRILISGIIICLLF